MSQAKEEQRPEPGQTDGAGRQQWQCKPPPTHPFCSVSVSPGGVSSPTYGLSEETLKALKITLPITPRIFVKNLAYGVNEAKLNEVFSLSGKIVQATLYRHENGETKPEVNFREYDDDSSDRGRTGRKGIKFILPLFI